MIRRMLQTEKPDGSLCFELNKVLLLMGHVFGWCLTIYATVANMPSHEFLFITMMTAALGGAISKGAVDTKQLQVKRDE